MVSHKVAKNTGARSAALRKWRKDFVEQLHPGDVLKAAPDTGRYLYSDLENKNAN
jgi:hypothetical protein